MGNGGAPYMGLGVLGYYMGVRGNNIIFQFLEYACPYVVEPLNSAHCRTSEHFSLS